MKTDAEVVQQFAMLVVYTAKSDKTQPSGKELRGWATDELLRQLDAYLIGQERDPEAYLTLTQNALTEFDVKAMPEIAVLLTLAVFRGLRLMPDTPGKEASLCEFAQDLEAAILRLPQSNRKERLLSLLHYHTGIFYDAYGHYAKAAGAQEQSAEAAKRFGDESGKAIARFVATVYHLKEVLCDGHPNPIGAHFAVLETRFKLLVEATRGSANEVLWGQWNGPVHMILACLWLGRDHPDWDTWAETALAAAEKLGKANQPLAQLVRALKALKAKEVSAVESLGVIVDEIGQTTDAKLNEVKAMALLALMQRDLATGDRAEAALLQWQIPESVKYIRAIAARLLP